MASGLTTQQLAHHDLLTGEGRRKAERQKASIDRWNQEVTDPNKTNAQSEDQSRDLTPPAAAHFEAETADQAGVYQQFGYDDPGSFQHQSSLSHRPHGSESPARRYDPYDLSPAYLGSHPDESADPSTHFDSYPAAATGNMHDSYDSSGYQQRYTPQKQANISSADNSYLNGHQNSPHHDQGMPAHGTAYGNAYSAQQDESYYGHPAPHDTSPFDFGVQQTYQSQGRQVPGQQGRGRGGKPPQPTRTNPGSHGHEEEQWGQTIHAAAGWDDGYSQNPSDHATHMGHSQHSDSSKWRASVDGSQRQRGNNPQGKGRGGYQQKQSARSKVSNLATLYQSITFLVLGTHQGVNRQLKNPTYTKH